MTSQTDALILDLVEWVAARPRPYDEVMAAWRTSCPRLTVWEDTVDRGLVVHQRGDGGGGTLIEVTPDGLALLRRRGRALPDS